MAFAKLPHMNFKEQRDRKAFLILENGDLFRGYSVGLPVDAYGEAVFYTGAVGYQEILSDASYSGQFIVMTSPEIGAYGVNSEDMESQNFFAAGLIVRNLNEPSNWRSQESLGEALVRYKVPAIAGIDTRSLTSLLSENGTQKAFICSNGELSPEEALAKLNSWEGIDKLDYASIVSCQEPYEWSVEGNLHVVVYDFGVKRSILENLSLAGMRISVVPAKTTAEQVLAMKPNGVLLSSGPGNPLNVLYAIENTKNLIGKIPIMGIGLGHQIIGLAIGGKIQKLKFGHHGSQPVKNSFNNSVVISSQNHNYVVMPEGIENKAEITYTNLNDGSIEGLYLKNEKVFSIQFDPETKYDNNSLCSFEEFINFLSLA
jgi:carbamoyl-phosphate synthase small subunit